MKESQQKVCASIRKEPSISVIIPAYNCERFIGHTLDSIYSQSCRPDEVIVVDDGSSDRTANIVNNYNFTEDRFQSYLSLVRKVYPESLPKYPMPDSKPILLVCLRQENKGPSAARNFGAQISKCTWLTFLDADDLWMPSTIEILLGVTRKSQQPLFVFGDGLNFTDRGKALDRLSSSFKEFPRGVINHAFEVISKDNPIVNGGAVLVKKELVFKAGCFREDISHGEDHDLWLKLSLFTKVACTDKVVLLRRRRGGALSYNQEAFYKARPCIFSDIGKAYDELLTEQEIDIGKHIRAAHYNLAYFYYLQGSFIKAVLAVGDWAWECLIDFFRRRKISRHSEDVDNE